MNEMIMDHILSCGKEHSSFSGTYRPPKRPLWRAHSEYSVRTRRLHGKRYIKKHTMQPKLAAKYVFLRKQRYLAELSAPSAIDLEQQFYQEAEKWDTETAHLSSPAQRFAHPSYVAILGMANDNREKIIDLLLRDMQQNRREWFWALSYLTHENPIPRAASGRLEKMIDAWVEWGRKNRG